MKRFLLVFWLSLVTSGVYAQDWATKYQQSVDYYNNYQSKEAKTAAEQALAMIKADQPIATTNHAVILRQLSLVCYDLGQDAAAISYAKEEVETLISINANQDMNFVNALQNLAVMRMSRSEYGAAEPLLKEALKLALTYHTEDSYEVAIINGNLAIVKFQLEADEEALALFQQSLDVLSTYQEVGMEYNNIIYHYGGLLVEQGDYEVALGYFKELEEFYNFETPNVEYGGILIKVGDVLDQLGRYAEAVEKYRLAITNFKEMGEESSEEYAIVLNNLSLDLQKTGQFAEATSLLEELMDQNAEDKSRNPAAYTRLATNYANLLYQKGNNVEAKKVFDEVVQLYDSVDITKDATLTIAQESLSGILLSEGKIKEAKTLIDAAVALAEEEEMSSRLYALYNQQAKTLTRDAKYEEARKVSERALDQALEQFGGQAIQTAFVRNTLAGVYTQLGQYTEAEKLYLDVLPVFKQVYGETHPEYATVAANYSSLLQLQGSYYTAEYYLKIAEEIKRNAFGKENRDYLTTYENLALLYLNTARYTEASLILEEILTVKEQLVEEKDPSLAYTQSNLAGVKKQLADYSAAEKLYKQARDIYKQAYGTSHIFYASVSNNLALLYQKMGNLEAARPLFQNALQIYETEIGKLNPDYATALENLATLYQLEENYVKAKELLEEALSIDEQILGKKHPLYSKTLHNLAAIYEREGAYDRSKELYQNALDIEREVFGENHPSFASTLYNLATLEQELENYDQALAYFQQVVEIRKTLLGNNHPDYAFSLYGLASIMHKTGDFEGARPVYQQVIDKYLENIREYFPALSESEKGAFYSKIKPVFDSYMDYAIDFNLLEKGTAEDRASLLSSMYDLQLATKALLLNASNKVKNRILNSGDQELINLFNDWTSLKENIVKAYAMTKEELERSELGISEMEAESNDLEKQLSLKSTAFAGEFEKQQISWQDVQAKLEANETALELIRIKKKMKTDSVLYVGLLVYPGISAPELVVNANGLQMEGKGFKTYKNLIIYKIEDVKSYPLFWEAIDHAIPESTETLFLSADGVINKVNIATLMNPESKQYMVDRYKIRLLSNTREIVENTGQSTESNDAEMFGFPAFDLGTQPKEDGGALFSESDMRSSFGSSISELPGTLEEVNNIENILQGGSWKVSKYTVRKATEDQIKALQSPKILHIATHGFFLADLKPENNEFGIESRNGRFNPLLRSGLLLAGAQNTINLEEIPGEEDGILTAYEAMNLDLDNTDLVVMSACETGLGEVKNGEGVYGLQRSFLVAGAGNLIMSLWKVNDATTQMLMSSFYKNWFEGKSRLEAFNLAIAEVRNEFKEPYYWGAFVMLGK